MACAFGVAMLIWLFHAGQFPWTEGDWREEWTFFLAWKQAFGDGTLPYYLGTAMQGTERYLANLQTPMMPYVAGLALVSINVFVLCHIIVALHRRLSRRDCAAPRPRTRTVAVDAVRR